MKLDLQYRAYRLVASLIGATGFTGVRLLGKWLGVLVWLMFRKRRILAVNNIKESLGVSDFEARRIARSAFISNMRSFLEALLIPQFTSSDPRFYVEGREIMERVRASDRPIINVTAHLGAWEFLASIVDITHHDGNSSMVVVRRYGSDAFNRLMAFLRGSQGCKVIGHRNAVLPILRQLKNKGTVGFLVDHHASKAESLTIPFLGKPASVNMGPAVLAVRAKALIVPVALIRRDEKYQMYFLEPLDTADLTGSFDEKVIAVAEFYTHAVETLIQLAPEQWFWLHNRWKK